MKASAAIGVALLITVMTAGSAAPYRTMLPTEWQLAPPPDVVTPTGTLPQGAALTGDGTRLVVVEDGDAPPAVRILDARTLAVERVIAMDGASGDPLPDPSGTGFWVSTAAKDSLLHIDAATAVIDRTISLPHPFWAAAIVRSPDGRQLAVTGDLADAVVFVDIASSRVSVPISVGRHPFGAAYARDGKTLYVANWAQSSLSVIDVARQATRETIGVGKHPDHLVISPDGRKLFVSEADDDTIGVVDTARGERVSGANAGPYGGKLFGASPSALALSSDGKRLYVADSAANAVAVLAIDRLTPHLIGAMPTGWYPTVIVAERSGNALDVIDGKGEGSRANPQFRPFSKTAGENGYIAREEIGSVRRIPIPDDATLTRGLDDVRANGAHGLRDAMRGIAGVPASSALRYGGTLRHVIYVVKENRTYDQVLGDLAQADGDPSLTLFGRNVTPNEHAIAERFGIFDNTFADAEVSADGHNWSMAAFANDYLERLWPPGYGGRRDDYDFEDGAEGSRPHGGYLWDDALAAGRSVRNYGEFTTEVDDRPDHIVSHMGGLGAVTDPHYPGFDLHFSDLDREAEWQREFATYVRDGTLPQLEIVRLPNDHTSGTRSGTLTPSAYVAQNDLAVGRLVEAVSHSRYWKDTAIFVVEDDAQNGPDHVDAQRMTAYVASAYSGGGVRHAHYSTAGIVRSIELILGLKPLSAFDASALPLSAAFASARNLRPYDARPSETDLTAHNLATAYGSHESAIADFATEDRVPDAELNRLLWHSVRGAAATPPPFGAF